MPLVITKYGKIRFAKVGDKIEDGEKQLFYRQGPNGGIVLEVGEREEQQKTETKTETT